MPLGPTEIGIIVALLFLLFGAKKIPELARSLGIAQREFQDAKQGVVTATAEPFQLEGGAERQPAGDQPRDKAPAPEAQPQETEPVLSPEEERRRKVLQAAKELNIEVEGRSLDEIKAEIKQRLD